VKWLLAALLPVTVGLAAFRVHQQDSGFHNVNALASDLRVQVTKKMNAPGGPNYHTHARISVLGLVCVANPREHPNEAETDTCTVHLTDGEVETAIVLIASDSAYLVIDTSVG
jgi:hypothetical protein